MVKRILLLGASKNIGLHVLEEIAPQKDLYELFVLARTPGDKVVAFPGKENVTFIQGDATDLKTVSDAVNNIMGGNVDFVVMTVGGDIVFNKFLVPKLSNPTIWYKSHPMCD